MRRTRRTLATTCAGLVAAGALLTVRFVDAADSGDGSGPSSSTGQPTDAVDPGELVTVEERDLVRSEAFDGVVGHGKLSDLRLVGDGTSTALPEVGQVIEFGQSIVEVDGELVVYLEGARPAWRALGAGVKGEDVRQLEAALVALGYADAAELEVDDTWSSATTAAVKLMQRWMGMPVDGRLDVAEVVFGTAPLRVAEIDGALGDPASAAGIRSSQLEQTIDVSLAASKAHLAGAGDIVDIELPSGEVVSGTVEAVGPPEASDDGKQIVHVTIVADGLAVPDGTPVTVSVAIVETSAATAVPASALLALAEGGYAVEVPDPSSSTGTRLVAVEIGEFADGWVEISGDIAPGDQVVVP